MEKLETVYDYAKYYYPHLWDKSRLEALVEAGRLTAEEYRELTGSAASEDKTGD